MYFDYKNIHFYYEKYGNGDNTLVILPGWGDTRKTFSYLIQILQDYYTIYIVDYPGFGNSSFPNYDMNIYDYTELIQEWLISLNLKNPVLLGHSFGGRILITLTGYYQYPYDKIILMNAAGIRPKKTFKSKVRTLCYKFLKKVSKILPKKYKENFSKKVFNYFSSADYRVLSKNMRKTFQNIVSSDLSPYLTNIKSDTLLLWGKDDTATPVSDAFIMNKKIKRSKLYVFLQAGHFVYLDKFQNILDCIVKFIEKEE